MFYYVALSRVKRLEDMLIDPFESVELKENEDVKI